MTTTDTAGEITRQIKDFVLTSPLNRLPYDKDYVIFDEPLVGFADGDDYIWQELKHIIEPYYLTPREALAMAYGKQPETVAEHVSVISWVLPISEKTRQSNRVETKIPACIWAHTRWYGEDFNNALRKHVVKLLTDMGQMAVAPESQPYFKRERNERGPLSNWSERHTAYVAGLGTFSLSDGFITERGIAHRCGSVVTDLFLPKTSRKGNYPYSNCLYYTTGGCKTCISRCPAGAISANGHDKIKCEKYQREDIAYVLKDYDVGVAGCGLCQTDVPCEFRNPTKKTEK